MEAVTSAVGVVLRKEKNIAEMVPDRLPQNASRGEKEVFAILRNVPTASS